MFFFPRSFIRPLRFFLPKLERNCKKKKKTPSLVTDEPLCSTRLYFYKKKKKLHETTE